MAASLERSLAFEVNRAARTVTFQRVGAWGAYLEPGRPYPYDDITAIFERDLLEPGSESLREAWEHAVGNGPSDNRMIEREFRALNPDTGDYEWHAVGMLDVPGDKNYGSIKSIDADRKRQLKDRYLARHDTLTGLLNRRAFEDAARDMAAAEDACGGFVIIDIDDFKRINDRFGHPSGDKVLEALGQLILACKPEGAVAGRFGGDEFVLCCPNGHDPNCLQAFIKALQEGVEAACGTIGERVSVSMGSARFPQDATTYADLLQCADIALLSAKQGGKNAVCAYSADLKLCVESNESRAAAVRRVVARLIRGSKRAAPILAACLLTFLVMAVAGTAYLRSLQSVMAEETHTYLHEISAQLSNNTERTISTLQEKTEVLRALVTQREWETTAELENWLEMMIPLEGLSQLYLIDDTGAWLSAGTRNQQIFMRDFSVDVGVHDLTRMSPAQNIGGQDYLVLGVPLDLTTGDGDHLVGLVSALAPASLSEQLSLSAFGDIGYAHLVTSDGRAVMRSDKATAAFTGYNVFEVLRPATFLDGGSIEELRATMAAGESGFIHYELNGVDKFATVTPVSIEDWYLLSVLPTDFVYEKSNLFTRLTLVACTAICVIFIALILIISMVQRRSKRRLKQAAFVDGVTGGNTALKFEQLVQARLASTNAQHAVVYVNIDSFKDLNDRLGRDGADRVLAKAYQVIEDTLKRGEYLCRIMADHFGVLLAEDDPEAVVARFDEWARQMKLYGLGMGNPFSIKLTAGAYFIEDAHVEVPRMLDRANLARQNLMRKGAPDGSACALYNKQLDDELNYRKSLEERAEHALESGEFTMYLQPKYELARRTVAGAEALVRWKHPVDGLIPPARFIPLFEENGFIGKLDLHVFRLACKWLQSMIDQGLAPIPVSVNLSRRCFEREGFLDDYEAVFREFDFPARLLELEFTESILYGRDESFACVIDRIHEIGWTCSLDDFGTGYSSLNMLGHLDFNAIKMDRKFFADIGEGEDRMLTTIRTSIGLIKKLGMTVVAEGVEDTRQVDLLQRYGCDLVQGYVFARPMPADELTLRLRGGGINVDR